MKNKINVKVALIGAGPACVSAAIQLQRSAIEILVIAEGVGGSIRNANLVENLAGFPVGISGEEYVNLLIAQLDNNQIPILLQKVTDVEYHEQVFKIITEQSEIYSEYLVVGTGAKPKKLGIKGEEEAFKQHLLYYDVYFAKEEIQDQKLLIVGSGDVAYDYALNLKDIVKSIKILQRTDKTKSLPILQRRLREVKNVEVVENVIPVRINVEPNFCLVVSEEENEIEIETDKILVAIGREPNITLLSDRLRKEHEDHSQIEKMFFVGDVKKDNYRQISIAMGDGMKAAMEIVKDILSEGGFDGSPW